MLNTSFLVVVQIEDGDDLPVKEFEYLTARFETVLKGLFGKQRYEVVVAPRKIIVDFYPVVQEVEEQ